jgi:hypothetical protein
VAAECTTFKFQGSIYNQVWITFKFQRERSRKTVGKRVEIVSSTRSLSRLGDLFVVTGPYTFLRKEVNILKIRRVDSEYFQVDSVIFLSRRQNGVSMVVSRCRMPSSGC